MQYDQTLDSLSWEQRGIQARDAGRHEEAESCFRRAVADHDGRPMSWLGLALSQIDLHRPDDAVVSLRRAQTLSPNSGVVRHLLDSLSGHTSQHAPDTYVTWLFNTYASQFDNHLLRLGYQGPDMLRQLAERAQWTPDGSRIILDLGCGTGLSGAPFRPYAGHLHGVDLAPKMLEQAQRRGIYDKLEHFEVHAALRLQQQASLDVVICADTLIYVGELTDLFRLTAQALKPDGSFLFTVETGETEFVLTKTGRYKHADSYVRRCATGQMHCVDQLDAAIRTENGKIMPGRAYRFVKVVN